MSITLVTGLWDIGRDGLEQNWNRPFQHYLDRFSELLECPYNMIIFGEENLQEIVYKKRTTKNTQFIVRKKDWFKSEFYDVIQKIRNNPEWYNQTTWLKESTQGRLDMYNPIVMSKVFLLNDARIFDKFNSSHLYWIDAGITNTVHYGYFTHDKVLDNLPDIEKTLFITFPYKAEGEIHGFKYDRLCELAKAKVQRVCRGGFFGGNKNAIERLNEDYYDLMKHTLFSGYMGTEESLFTIMLYRNANFYNHFEINEDGLLSTFFENLKNKKINVNLNKIERNSKIASYILTYNSPNQVRLLLKTFEEYDKDLINIPDIYLINNSTDESKDEEYQDICDTYKVIHLKQSKNLGICGGRQFAAYHSDAYGYDYHLFFEDDMFFTANKNSICKNGMYRGCNNILKNSILISKKENLDFLKLSFSEFFGDNSKQWAWFNVPQDIREKFWQDNTDISKKQNIPNTDINYIGVYNSTPYAVGDIFYSNWPQIVSRQGNRKMFLETTWEHPYEQTWMSYIFQKTKEKYIKAGVLLLSPIEHNRFDHYPKEERREN